MYTYMYIQAADDILYITQLTGCSYLALQPNYDVSDKPRYAPILLSI